MAPARRSFIRDEPGGVSIVLSGRVKVLVLSATGKEVILAFRGPGEIVGEVAAIAGSPRSCAVRSLEPVETLAVGASDFRHFLASHARASTNLVLILIERLPKGDGSRGIVIGVTPQRSTRASKGPRQLANVTLRTHRLRGVALHGENRAAGE
jgi:hypothetical protein